GLGEKGFGAPGGEAGVEVGGEAGAQSLAAGREVADGGEDETGQLVVIPAVQGDDIAAPIRSRPQRRAPWRASAVVVCRLPR
ncbi:hypothetical protein ACFXG4_39630, partial [Nocardia sp. NPDC059246]|uniref:hypothetical protein n=1 Tax=Nocardia sp. NPDC059246 TaxID=3346789 RepID=UPI0036BDBF1A